MLSKVIATVFVLFLLSVLRRLREERLESQSVQQQQRLSLSINQEKKRQRNITSLSKKKVNKPRGEFAAVSVRFTPNACEAVRALAGQRFLSKDAPLMPLQNCPRRNICNCFYEYHEDRRSNDERSDFNVAFGILPNYDEDANKQRRWYDSDMKKVS